MSDITVAKLQDVLNDIERNAYEGILGSEEITRAYVLAGELGENIEKLKAENAKLRQERNHWHVEQVHAYGNWEDAHKRVIELEAENAKLRELASAAHSCKTNDGCCEDCYCDEGCCPIERRMRDLGIEVPE